MAQEGQTATNPQTGERVILRGGQWVPLGGGAQLPTATIPNAAPNEQAKSNADLTNIGSTIVSRQVGDVNTNANTAKTEVQTAQERLDLQSALEARARGVVVEDAATTEVRNQLKAVQQAKNYVNSFSTGTVGNVIESIPLLAGTDRDKLEAALGTIRSGAKFNMIQTLKERGAAQGAQGTGLGATAVPEFEALGRVNFNLERDVLDTDPKFVQGELTKAEETLLRRYAAVALPSSVLVNATPEERKQLLEASYQQALREYQNGFNPPEAGGEQGGALREEEGLTGSVTYDPSEWDANGNYIGPQSGKADAEATRNALFDQRFGTGNVRAVAAGAGDVVQGVGDTLGILANPLNALVNATGIPEAIGGGRLSTDFGALLREQSGLPDNPNELVSAINRGAAGGLAFGGLANTGARVATGATQRLLQNLGATPLTDAVTGGSAALGAELAREDGAGALGQTAAALLSGGTGYGLSRATNRLLNATTPSALARAANEENIRLLPADAGGPVVRRLTGGLSQAPISAGPILRASEESVNSAGAAVQRNVDALGGRLAEAPAGNTVKAAASDVASSTAVRSQQLIDDMTAKADGLRPVPNKTLALVDKEIDRLNAAPGTNASAIAELETLRGDIAKGVNLTGLRDLRTSLAAGTFDGKVRSTPQRNLNKRLIGALTDDIREGLAERPEAQAAFDKFNRYYSERAGVMDQFQSILGDTEKSGEQLLTSIESMAKGGKGGEAALRTVFTEMKPAEANGLRATLIDRLGRAQNNSDFSPSTFFTSYSDKMTTEAKDAVFGTGDLRKSLDRIATVTKEMKNAGRFSNSSNTGSAINVGVLAAPSATAAMSDSVTAGQAFVSTLMIAGAQYGAAKLLSSPRFASWLARAPKTNDPLTIRNYATKLTGIAAAQPDAAEDIKAYQQTVLNATKGVKPKGALAE